VDYFGWVCGVCMYIYLKRQFLFPNQPPGLQPRWALSAAPLFKGGPDAVFRAIGQRSPSDFDSAIIEGSELLERGLCQVDVISSPGAPCTFVDDLDDDRSDVSAVILYFKAFIAHFQAFHPHGANKVGGACVVYLKSSLTVASRILEVFPVVPGNFWG